MAFGKILVRSESGELQEFDLEKPVTSVGRQPGNDIVLNTTAVSRYHAQFAIADGQVYLVDLGTVNGTFVNDVQVEPNSRVPLSDGDRIMMGDMLLTFHSPETRHRLDIELTPAATVVEDPSLPFRLVIDEPHQQVAPGARMQLLLSLENLAGEELALEIGTRGMDPAWLRLNRREVLLGPREQSEAMISILPPRSSETRPGRYALTVYVALQRQPDRALEAVREIDVVGYSELAMIVQPEGRDSYAVVAQNQGNVPLTIDLGGFDPGGSLTYQFRPPYLQLEPGASAQAGLRVGQRGSLKAPLTFAVVARSRDAAGFQAPVLARYTPTSPAGIGLGFLALALVLGVLLLGVLVLGGAYLLGIGPFAPPEPQAAVVPVAPTVTPTAVAGPTPTLIPAPEEALAPTVGILSFEAKPSEVFYRTDGSLILAWQIAGEVKPERVSLRDQIGQFDRVLPLTAAAIADGELSIPVHELEPGIHNFQLTIVGEDGEPLAQSLTGVTVQPTACQVLDPESVVRAAPDEEAPEADEPIILSEVVLAGRSPDGEWAWVAYNNPDTLTTRAWISAGEITCPPDVNLEDYVIVGPDGEVLGAASSTPGPTPSPDGATGRSTPALGAATPGGEATKLPDQAITLTPSG